MREFRHSLRALRRAPGVAAVAICTLALASGVALLLPAWRATAVDPASVLKQD